jgi:RNA polymerase sigma-70 factor (ECF subfamily)
VGGTPIGPVDRSRIREEDLALARRAAAGDRVALHAVVDRHADALYRLARALCPTAADAEDVVQDTLIAAFGALRGFDGRASLLTWMSRILVRRARRLGRKLRSRQPLSLDEASDAPGTDARLLAAPDDEDCRLDLAAALPALPPEYREVIVLRELHGMSYAEIAATLGIPQGTVESRIHRARCELRERLRAYRP